MKKLICTLAALSVLFSSVCYANAHTENTPYSWYFRKNSEHKQPPLDHLLRFVEDYDVWYVDKSAVEGEIEKRVVYLTFDAGYENGNIEKILDVMKAHDAHGAFFVLDNLVRRSTELVMRMAAEGHLICNHTSAHPDMSRIRDEAKFGEQLTSLEQTCRELTGYELDRFYRPPEGRFSEQNLKYLKKLNYKTIFWSFAYVDWNEKSQPNEEEALTKILDHVHPGAVLLLHPTSATNAAIMDRLLSALEADGYTFGSLYDLTKIMK